MLHDLVNWMLEVASRKTTTTELLGSVVHRLNLAGFGLLRANIVMGTLHPEVWGSAIIWQKSADFRRDVPSMRVVDTEQVLSSHGLLRQVDYAVAENKNPTYVHSPLYCLVDGEETSVRKHISPDMTDFEYSIYRDFATQGATDYYARALVFSNGARSAITWLTEKEGGFTEADIEVLDRIAQPFALILEIHAARRVTNTLLETYLGAEPGRLVLAGKIKPGDVERINAAIWFSDLRNFTGISTRLESEALIALLNEYFGAVGKAIQAEGGGILKFIGDAVLAIYPVYDASSESLACQRMLAAAGQANAALDELNVQRVKRGDLTLEHGIALHFGEVQYGNIGANRRLDFTVIGNAVNLASRLEGLCGRLGRRLIVSADFAARLDTQFETLGQFELKGIPGVVEALGLPERAST